MSTLNADIKRTKTTYMSINIVLNNCLSSELELTDKHCFDQIETTFFEYETLCSQTKNNKVDSFIYAFNEQFLNFILGLSMIVFCSCFIPGNASAHEDTPIFYKDDGTLSGLPEKFYPANLFLKFDTVNLTKRLTNAKVILSGEENMLPGCIIDTINSGSFYDIQIYASWYHYIFSPNGLPSYLLVKFFDNKSPEPGSTVKGLSVLFNLENSGLIEIKLFQGIQMEGFDWPLVRYYRIPLTELCSELELIEIKLH